MLKRGFAIVALVSVSGVMALQERTATACGGCFSPPTENTVVDGHRMAFAISKTQTVLWDQFNYSGDPKEFAWVLPVRPGTRVELSHDEFIAALEAATQPIIVAPASPNNGGGGGGCGSATSLASNYGSSPGDSVIVVSQQVVGPYEVVTLKATDPKALTNWLTAHGYAIPPAIQPTLDAYVKEGFDFIALRLLPNKGVSAMKPVRVVSPGADVTLPLRMVAAGIGAKVGVVLYVLGEGRYEAANYPNVTVDFANLTWDSTQNRSNYNELVTAALAGGDGRGWFTEFADYAFNQRYNKFTGAVGPSSGLPTLESAYASAIPGSCTTNPFDAGTLKDSGGMPDGSGDGSSDAAAPPDAGAPLDAGLPPAPNNDCTFDDITVATTGMTRSDVWISRLRANLPATVLSVDLKLQASASQTQLDGIHQASAPSHGDGCTTARTTDDNGTVITVGVGALGLAILLRRRRQRA